MVYQIHKINKSDPDILALFDNYGGRYVVECMEHFFAVWCQIHEHFHVSWMLTKNPTCLKWVPWDYTFRAPQAHALPSMFILLLDDTLYEALFCTTYFEQFLKFQSLVVLSCI